MSLADIRSAKLSQHDRPLFLPGSLVGRTQRSCSGRKMRAGPWRGVQGSNAPAITRSVNAGFRANQWGCQSLTETVERCIFLGSVEEKVGSLYEIFCTPESPLQFIHRTFRRPTFLGDNPWNLRF